MLSGRVAILMVDDREVGSPSPSGTTLAYPSLAFALNAEYACSHGYDLLYYRMVGPSCSHATQGERHGSYCKLPAIAHALGRGYDAVAFIDSDSYFRIDVPRFRNMSVPQLVAEYSPPLTATAPRGGPSAWFACDLPQLGDRPNGGFHVWRAGEMAKALLAHWWHAPAGRFATEHDFEQHVLQWQLHHLAAAIPALATLQLKAMADTFAHAVAHVDHTKAERRRPLLAAALLRASLEAPARPAPAALMSPLASSHEQASLRRLLGQADAALPASPGASIERRLLKAVARRLRPRAAQLHVALATRQGAACGGRGARLRVVTYNATEAARRELPAGARHRLPPEGLPLALRRCGDAAGGGEPGVDTPPQPPDRHSLSIPSATGAQRWEAVAGGGWRLAELGVSPRLCLRVGPRKAPKPPHLPLAQLGSCENESAARSRSEVVFRLERHGDVGGSALLRTAATTAELGRELEAMVRDAGESASAAEGARRLGEKPRGTPRGRQRRREKSPLWQVGR